jgi:hypothetical protein
MAASLRVIRGAGRRAASGPPRNRIGAGGRLPNVADRGPHAALSDDPAARRRELLAVIAICAAQARGERERGACERRLAMVRDS